MDIQEFSELELKFLSDLKESDLYKEYKSLSLMIDKNEELNTLSKERDELVKKADSESDYDNKRTLLKQYLDKQAEIENNPLMKEYLEKYEKIRKILNHLSDGLNKEII